MPLAHRTLYVQLDDDDYARLRWAAPNAEDLGRRIVEALDARDAAVLPAPTTELVSLPVAEVWGLYRAIDQAQFDELRYSDAWPLQLASGGKVVMLTPIRLDFDDEPSRIVGYHYCVDPGDDTPFVRHTVRPDATLELKILPS